ncbi:hypothetical protein AiwAL_00230 [Acidiphilium sp. AL]|uniref:DUF5666 domain-containing protein n=1 Tax=Acidiphilium iwatense TaxID=768198 RepID=A0ABS9E0C9_9PROT|nr:MULTISPECIES: hypothetical protein [Acidiphilium]MCF3948467.1 hypothetical protein [Acidiphilium iwatense]MCU4158534.1 hypothetical protein [Acidiphilium sp. AL]
MTRTKFLLLACTAATLLGAGAVNAAGTKVSALPSYSGTLEHFTITPRGSIDGVILSDGTDAVFPPYLSTQIAYAAKLGDKVTIHGLKVAGEKVVQGVSITDNATNRTVTDNGKLGVVRRMMAQGKIAQYLYGPDGRKNGVLLDDGTALHMPPPDLAKPPVAAMLKPGTSIAAVGFGTANALGKMILVRQIGPDFKDLTRIAPPHPPHGWRHPHGPMMRRMMMRHMMMEPMHGPGMAPPPPASTPAGSTSK